jgi:hypothetical protein
VSFLLRPLAINPANVDPTLALAGSPGGNLADPQPRATWAIATPAAPWVQAVIVDFGGDVFIDTIALLYHTGLGTGNWNAYSRTAAQGPFPNHYTTGGSTPLFTGQPWRVAPTVETPRVHALYLLPAVQQLRYLDIIVESTASTNANWSAGVLAVGQRFQPLNGFGQAGHDWGGGRRVSDLSTVRVTDDGARASWRKARVPEVRWSWSHLDESELRTLWGQLLTAGESGPLLFVEDPAETIGLQERIHYGTLAGLDFYERRQTEKSRIDLRLIQWL